MAEVTISVKDDQGVIDEVITTDSYLILYLEKDKIKASGDISLKSLAPYLMKSAIEKLTK